MADVPKVRPLARAIIEGRYDDDATMWPTAYREHRKADRNEDPLPYSAWFELRLAEIDAPPLTFTLSIPLTEDTTMGDLTAAIYRLGRNMEFSYGDSAYPFAGQGGHIMLKAGDNSKPVGKWGVDRGE